MKPSSLAIPLLLGMASDLVGAARLNIRGRPRPRFASSGAGFVRRASIVGGSSVSDVGDVEYVTDIKLGGITFSVQIDTGSSDLWVVGDVPNAQNTGKAAKVTYAVGGVEGSVLMASLDFAGYTVSNQAYISVAASSDNAAGSGLIGLGPNYGSQVSDAIGTSAGDAVLDRIFKQNTSTPNYITVLLGRTNDPTDPSTGDLTVGEILPGYEQIASQPKLAVSVLASSNSVNQHWQILLDADGIIGPANNNVIDEFDVVTAVSSTSNKKQLTVVLDTGYSLPQVPSSVASAFYKDIPGAELVSRSELSGDVWQLPCDKEVNVTFKFGGSSFPIHPLDTNIDLNLTDSNGNHVCFGAFQPMVAQNDATYDAIFGMAFLRNTYTSINFGDFVEGSTNTTADPYVQLLATTNNTAEAHSDFLRVRGNSPWTPSDASFGERIRAHLPLVIGLAIGAGLLFLGGLLLCCAACRRRRRGAAGKAGVGMPFFQAGQTYQPLHEPAPEAYNMHAVGGQGGYGYGQQPPAAAQPAGYQPQGGYQPQSGYQPPAYSNPWDARY
ncbi:acid protease [Ganoderma leucocontextum]|nr:acid protease [Ganoderma leucocontextum]